MSHMRACVSGVRVVLVLRVACGVLHIERQDDGRSARDAAH